LQKETLKLADFLNPQRKEFKRRSNFTFKN